MGQVFRCYVEKRPGFDVEAVGLLRELREQLQLPALTGVRIFNRYDVDLLDEAAYRPARDTVFSEPQCDAVYDEAMPDLGGAHILLAVEALPGQYDQRSDSARQCIQLLTGGERPRVQTAKVYVLMGDLTGAGCTDGPWIWETSGSCRTISATRSAGTPPSLSCGWWTPTGPTTAGTPPSTPTSTPWRFWTAR